MKQKIENFLYYLLILLIPLQLGKHFWPDFSYVLGIRIDYLSPTVYLTDILIGLLFVLLVVRKFDEKLNNKSKIKNQKSKIQSKTKKYSLLFFVGLFFIFNILQSDRILASLYSGLKILEMTFLAYYTAYFVRKKAQTQNIILLLGTGVIFESFLAIVQFVKQGSVGGLLYFFGERSFSASTPGIANTSLNGELVLRPYATFPHPNVLAGFLIVVMILILFSFNFRKSKIHNPLPALPAGKFLIQSLSLVMGTIALFLTMSRVAILLWSMIIGLYLFKKIKRKMIIGIYMGLFVIFALSPIGARFTNIHLADEAIVQRKDLISASVEMIKTNPLFGVGLSNFLPTLATIQKPLAVGFLQPVHNIFLLTASEIGLVGLGFFVWFLRQAYRRIMNQESGIRVPLVLVLSAILIIGMFDHYFLTLQQGQLLFGFVLGLSWMDFHNRE